jgi:Arc/MetJ family transcription regulator
METWPAEGSLGSFKVWRCLPNSPHLVYSNAPRYVLFSMSKRLIDLDDHALNAARAELGTTTIKSNVNEALRRASAERTERIRNSLDVLAAVVFDEREDAWR